MKQWDKGYYAILTPLFFVMFILSILDANRFHWNPIIPLFFIVIGIIVYSLGQTLLLWAKKTNLFFSSVVRIQQDRTHTVCMDGPYQLVRHPGYLGGIVFTLATPLRLGSFWGLLPALLVLVLVFWRTPLEDTTLKNELPRYLDYSLKVKYKLIPFLW